MYCQSIEGILPGQKVKIKYDCDGGFERCGKEFAILLRYAEKNAKDNGGQHVCRQCVLRSKNPMNRQEVKDKLKNTNLERYGATTAMNTQENIEGRRQLFQDEAYKEQWLEKHRVGSRKKYGTDYPMQTAEVQERQKAVMREKYGVDHPCQSAEIMKKMMARNKEKYGVENVASLPEVRVKMAKTTLERFGVEHYNQLPEMKDYLRANCKEWLAESYANPWAKGITRPEEWNQKQRETVTQLMTLGTWKAGYSRSKKGFCFPANKCKKSEVYFRSSYEAIYCFYLDNHPNVDWFSFECMRIPYEYGGKIRYYVPDFLIKWVGNDMLSIHELKAEFLREYEQVQLKQQCAESFGLSHNMKFTMLYSDDIKSLGIDFETLKQSGFVKTEL